jgi:hypothetical protein
MQKNTDLQPDLQEFFYDLPLPIDPGLPEKKYAPAFVSELAIDYREFVDTLNYDLETGVFTRRLPSRFSSKRAGDEFGTISFNEKTGCSYRVCMFGGRMFYCHRLAYLWVNGVPSHKFVDHADGDTLNNSYKNLRLASREQNNQNSKKSRRNTSGFKGVTRNKNSFIASIRAFNQTYYLGSFASAEDAFEARNMAAKDLHGVFPRNS